MEGLLAWELGDLVLVPGLLLPALRMALGLSIHHLSNGYGNVFSLKVGKCTKVPGRGCGIGCTLPTLLGYTLSSPTPLESEGSGAGILQGALPSCSLALAERGHSGGGCPGK